GNPDKPGMVECFALVKNCEKKNAKNGTFYLDILLADKDGEMYSKMWDYREDVTPLPEVNTVVKARGTLQQYNGNDQFIIQRLRPAVAGDNVSVSDFVKSADFSGEEMYGVITSLVASFNDEELKRVVSAILDDHKEELVFFPAAEKLHHAMAGGLLYHTLSIVRLAECVCGIYPSIDKELLVSGAILHDIAKLKEYKVNNTGLVDGHTVEGMLLGHLVMGSEEVGRKCDELGISENTKVLLQHMLISHHGKLEFGAAVRPSFIEAEILSQLDLFDANMYEMAEAIGGVSAGEFTGRLWMLDNRKMFNHGRVAVEPKADLIK
ncbi:MAG: HD domain-containing protein, partial [Clostridia bacterium]|nr:HD domain-containing protein [Clostridia bacterium]